MGEKKERLNQKRKKIAFILFPIIVTIGAVAIYLYLQYSATHISTDDAFVDGRMHVIAPKVAGTVKAIHIKDNQLVKTSDLILEIDPVDYEVMVRQAQADLDNQRTTLSEIRDSVDTVKKQMEQIAAALEAGQANLEVQQANLELAKVNFQRAEMLLKKEAIAKQQYDNAKNGYEVASAQVRAGEAQVRQLEASLEAQKALVKQTAARIPSQKAQIRQKEAVLQGAELNRGYTKIYAPADGYITKRTVEIGNQVQPGQPLMAVVPLNQEDIWITANYKETQLKQVKPGQKVAIKVDTYPGHVFDGKVDSVMAGTGAVFSLFPPENATGNFVKVVQRVPVKIVLDKGSDPSHLLRIGMSVVPTILIEE
ncbi:MAG TPA: HlyD family secretion protein [Thermodesulfobacteriota bacterium]